MSSYSERAYFDGDYCQHMATREEHVLRDRRRKAALGHKASQRMRFDPATLQAGQPENPVHAMHAKLALGWRYVA